MNRKPDIRNSILVMDLGNTAIKWARFSDGGTLSGFESVVGTAGLRPALKQVQDAPMAVVIGRSGPGEALEMVREHFGMQAPVVELAAKLPPGIASEYAEGQAGTDRLANVAGAVALGLCPCVIVDAGSAITLELVDDRPIFLGGAILPGIDLQSRALQRGTAALPRIDVKEGDDLPEFPGKNTGAAIEAGIVLGALGAVDGLVTQALDLLGANARVIFTGGNGRMFAENTRQAGAIYNRHLTLHGLYAMYQAQGNSER